MSSPNHQRSISGQQRLVFSSLHQVKQSPSITFVDHSRRLWLGLYASENYLRAASCSNGRARVTPIIKQSPHSENPLPVPQWPSHFPSCLNGHYLEIPRRKDELILSMPGGECRFRFRLDVLCNLVPVSERYRHTRRLYRRLILKPHVRAKQIAVDCPTV